MYLDFARELKKLWNLKVTVIATVIGELETHLILSSHLKINRWTSLNKECLIIGFNMTFVTLLTDWSFWKVPVHSDFFQIPTFYI